MKFGTNLLTDQNKNKTKKNKSDRQEKYKFSFSNGKKRLWQISMFFFLSPPLKFCLITNMDCAHSKTFTPAYFFFIFRIEDNHEKKMSIFFKKMFGPVFFLQIQIFHSLIEQINFCFSVIVVHRVNWNQVIFFCFVSISFMFSLFV